MGCFFFGKFIDKRNISTMNHINQRFCYFNATLLLLRHLHGAFGRSRIHFSLCLLKNDILSLYAKRLLELFSPSGNIHISVIFHGDRQVNHCCNNDGGVFFSGKIKSFDPNNNQKSPLFYKKTLESGKFCSTLHY